MKAKRVNRGVASAIERYPRKDISPKLRTVRIQYKNESPNKGPETAESKVRSRLSTPPHPKKAGGGPSRLNTTKDTPPAVHFILPARHSVPAQRP